jgi:hypothetical protein
MRNEQGKFVKGTSGNPLGRPRVILTVRDIAREHSEEAIETLAAIMRDEATPAAARISACTELLNRGHGRPVDQRTMLMIGAQLKSDRSVREWSTKEIIDRLADYVTCSPDEHTLASGEASSSSSANECLTWRAGE